MKTSELEQEIKDAELLASKGLLQAAQVKAIITIARILLNK